jgi:hypothetical protein
MGGAAKKAEEKVKETARRVTRTAEDAAAAVVNPIGYLSGVAGEAITGEKVARTAFNPFGEATGEVGEKLVDKPKAEKEAFKRQQAAIESKNRRTLKDLKDRKAQEEAEEEAGEQLLRQRARQRRRRRGGTGRSSTILTENLGDAGGETTGRKTLLGM